jgi:hypothetical protein
LFLVAGGRGLAKEATEGALVEGPADGDADADERDGDFRGGPDDEADAVFYWRGSWLVSARCGGKECNTVERTY